ncbi:MAG: radical SAM protein [Lachnospiraceae bacterium]|nr:radical SAM protein [Lachnospiraceae bacterium]
MRLKTILDEDFVNYQRASMFIGTVKCGGKCCIEAGIPMSVCQNDEWRNAPVLEMSTEEIYHRYLDNNLTSAIVFGGLEPFEQFDELRDFIAILRTRYHCEDEIVIYTGYNKDEIQMMVDILSKFSNIIIKFGRYIPNRKSRFDEVLGITLASDNQYAERIS